MLLPEQRSLSKVLLHILLLAIALLWLNEGAAAQGKVPRFNVIALAERGGVHKPFVDAAKVWLSKLANENNFTVDYIEDTEKISDAFLSKYNLFLQLNYPPYNWTDAAKAAFVEYIEEGKGGWIGFHHATLLGEFDGFAMWPWFHEFMGGVRFKNYIATFVTGAVMVEDKDHPVIWTNERVKARTVYIFMGHHPELLENQAFTQIFKNSLFWAVGK
jgi:type 1 glutamine amidotransferase